MKLQLTDILVSEDKRNRAPQVLSSGCGRCGTGFMAECLTSFGLDVRHELMGENGTSNWHVGTRLENPSQVPTIVGMQFDLRVHQVRHPLAAFESILRFIIPHSIFGWAKTCIRAELGVNLDPIRDDYELAFCYWLYWNLLVEKNIEPDIRFRIEEGQISLYYLLARHLSVQPPNRIVSRRYNTGFRAAADNGDEAERIRHNAVDMVELDSGKIFKRISTSLQHQIRERAGDYGYDVP